MKKFVFVLCLLLCNGWVMAQQQVITYPGYTSYWNPATLIPDSVIWISSPHKKVADREAGFHATAGRPNLTNDYKHSGYDIGHNCNASDENGNSTDEYNSFDYVNTFPQRPNNNRKTWLDLEDSVRTIGTVKNKVSWYGVIGKMGKDSVIIPLYVVKEIWSNGHYEKYVMPNTDTVNKHHFTYYRVK